MLASDNAQDLSLDLLWTLPSRLSLFLIGFVPSRISSPSGTTYARDFHSLSRGVDAPAASIKDINMDTDGRSLAGPNSEISLRAASRFVTFHRNWS